MEIVGANGDVSMNTQAIDLVIVGAGPTGLACAIEAKKYGIPFVVLEKGVVTDAIRRFPTFMRFFSTAEMLELDHIPFPSVEARPTRVEALQYYRKVAEYADLPIEQYTEVLAVQKQPDGSFLVKTNRQRHYQAQFVIIATGYYDTPNQLDVPGEELPMVSHYYTEPFPYVHTHCIVIGGSNSAVETALDLYRHGAEVTVIHRGAQLSPSVKYWLRPDIENRIKNGEIRAEFSTRVTAIEEGRVWCQNQKGEDFSIPADFVFAMIGYHSDSVFLASMGIEIVPEIGAPQYSPETFETNVENLYIAGTVACGCETWNIFIENGRSHAVPILADIRRKQKEGCAL